MSLDAFVVSDPTLEAPLGTSYAANLVFASPNGSSGKLIIRALVAADIPALPASQITSGTVATARLGTGTASSTTYLRGDQTWTTVSASETLSTVLIAGNNAAGTDINMGSGSGSGGGTLNVDNGYILNTNELGFTSGGALSDDGSGDIIVSGALQHGSGDCSIDMNGGVMTIVCGDGTISGLGTLIFEDASTMATAAGIPGLPTVMTVNNDAGGYDITGLGALYSNLYDGVILGANGGGSVFLSMSSGSRIVSADSLSVSGALADGTYSCGTGSITINNGVISAVS